MLKEVKQSLKVEIQQQIVPKIRPDSREIQIR